MEWPYRLADLGSAIGLAPQSLGLLMCQRVYRGVIFVILAKGKPVPLAWEIIYMNGEVMRVTSTILPKMGLKCVTEA